MMPGLSGRTKYKKQEDSLSPEMVKQRQASVSEYLTTVACASQIQMLIFILTSNI